MDTVRILIAVTGFAAAGLAYLALSLLLLASRQRRAQGLWFVLASAAMIAWAVANLLALQTTQTRFVILFEVLHLAGWLALLYHILHRRLAPRASLPLPLRLIQLAALALGLLAVLEPFRVAPALTPGPALMMVLFTVFGLVLVEQVYRSTRTEDRWAIKFFCVGLAGMLVVDFYFFANGVLFGRLDPDVAAARGYVAALVGPLLTISAARNPQWSAPVGVSRRLAFHTASLIGSGVYLLLMAGAGYYLKLYGGDWGDIVLTVFLFAATTAGLLVVFSGASRARLRVFLAKHFFRYHYDYREEWLKFTRRLADGRLDDHLGERTIEALASLIESPGGALWLNDDSARWPRSHHWNWRDCNEEIPADAALLAWLTQHRWVVDLDEWRRRPGVYGGLELPAWLARPDEASVLIPLIQHDALLGIVVLKRPLAKLSYDWEVRDLLKVAAQQATTHLAQMRATAALIVARQFESFNRTTTFVVHDLKNLVAQLSLLLKNAERHRDNPEFQADMLETVASAVARMNKVLAQLKRADDTVTPRTVSLAEVLTAAVASKRGFRLTPTLKLSPTDVHVRANAPGLTRALGHLIQNALEATAEDGQVTITASLQPPGAQIEIHDTGCGMDADFIRDRLFQPFDSTKGAGMGIGVYEARETLRLLGGQIRVESTPGLGTRFIIALPLEPEPGIES